MEAQDQQGLLGLLVQQGQQVQTEVQGQQVLLGQQGQQDHKVTLELKV